jgi:hypothetical protein
MGYSFGHTIHYALRLLHVAKTDCRQRIWYGKKLIRLFRRGEQTATALENNLANLESKIDQLLASFEGDLTGEPAATGKEAAADADGKGETGRSGDVEEKKSA